MGLPMLPSAPAKIHGIMQCITYLPAPKGACCIPYPTPTPSCANPVKTPDETYTTDVKRLYSHPVFHDDDDDEDGAEWCSQNGVSCITYLPAPKGACGDEGGQVDIPGARRNQAINGLKTAT